MDETVVETVTEEPVELEATELTATEEGTETPEISPEDQARLEMEALAMRVVGGIRQVYQSGDQIVAILTCPDLLEPFTAAFRAIPEQILDPNLRDNVPIAADPNVPQLRLVTGTDLEMQFLTNRYGPREDGGNGLLRDLEQLLMREQSPVRLTHEFMRCLYLMEMVEKVKPKIIAPTGAELLRATLNPRL
jgi:hypothetical protein